MLEYSNAQMPNAKCRNAVDSSAHYGYISCSIQRHNANANANANDKANANANAKVDITATSSKAPITDP